MEVASHGEVMNDFVKLTRKMINITKNKNIKYGNSVMKHSLYNEFGNLKRKWVRFIELILNMDIHNMDVKIDRGEEILIPILSSETDPSILDLEESYDQLERDLIDFSNYGLLFLISFKNAIKVYSEKITNKIDRGDKL